jgi:hypothetical protein
MIIKNFCKPAPPQYCVGFGFRSPQPPLRRGAENLLKSPNLAGDLGGSISGKLQNLRSIAPLLVPIFLQPAI